MKLSDGMIRGRKLVEGQCFGRYLSVANDDPSQKVNVSACLLGLAYVGAVGKGGLARFSNPEHRSWHADRPIESGLFSHYERLNDRPESIRGFVKACNALGAPRAGRVRTLYHALDIWNDHFYVTFDRGIDALADLGL